MRSHSRVIWLMGFLLTAMLPQAVAAAPESNSGVARQPAGARTENPARVIVGWRASPADSRVRIASVTSTDRVQALGVRLGLRLQALRELTPQMQLVKLDDAADAGSHEEQLRRLRADADVEFAEPDYRRFRHAVPDDPLYVNQWYLQTPPSPPVPPSGPATTEINSAINAEQAWDRTMGVASTVVAVLDTGVRFEHPDLLTVAAGGRFLPGFDFVSGESTTSFLAANDGDGWDPDPSDPGDWITPAETQTSTFFGCAVGDSSWHGTRVAGMLGAITNNATGIAGGSWQPLILPVRVLGKCFGNDSDIIVAMRWAAGISVAGVPDNPVANRANIINLSLGAAGACPASYAPVISELATMGVLVVVSAGNGSGGVDSPGNCHGVLAVSGLRHSGTKVGYSSFGPEVGVSAPAGNCVNTGVGQPCLFYLATTLNLGATTPGASSYTTALDTDSAGGAAPNIGTSFSAPLVSGIAALMHAVNTHLTTAQMIARIKEGAVTFPMDATLPTCPATDTSGQCNCTTTTCGAGMANALKSVIAAQRPIANVAAPPATSTAGQHVMLDGSASTAADGSALTYAWTALAGASAPSAGANTAIATITAPAAGIATYRLTVTDNQGLQDHADVSVTVPSGGGGGSGGAAELLLLACAVLAKGRSRRAFRPADRRG